MPISRAIAFAQDAARIADSRTTCSEITTSMLLAYVVRAWCSRSIVCAYRAASAHPSRYDTLLCLMDTGKRQESTLQKKPKKLSPQSAFLLTGRRKHGLAAFAAVMASARRFQASLCTPLVSWGAFDRCDLIMSLESSILYEQVSMLTAADHCETSEKFAAEDVPPITTPLA